SDFLEYRCLFLFLSSVQAFVISCFYVASCTGVELSSSSIGMFLELNETLVTCKVIVVDPCSLMHCELILCDRQTFKNVKNRNFNRLDAHTFCAKASI
ncbi:hypothetical protein L9F63_026980, partial [Diploptera punctata]